MTLQEQYTKEIRPNLYKELGLKNIFQVPRPVKIVVNVGVGEAISNKKILEDIGAELTQITGQKAIITLARKSIAAFKIRKGMPIGVKVTLRGKKMYDFFEKLTRIVLPRFRDFAGLSENAVDRSGNLNIGITEQTLFPEIEYDKISKLHGLQATVVVRAKSRDDAKVLWEKLGVPFKKIAQA